MFPVLDTNLWYTSFLFSDFEVSGFYCDTRFWRSICHNPSAFASFCHLSLLLEDLSIVSYQKWARGELQSPRKMESGFLQASPVQYFLTLI